MSHDRIAHPSPQAKPQHIFQGRDHLTMRKSIKREQIQKRDFISCAVLKVHTLVVQMLNIVSF